MSGERQEHLDRFYWSNGPCCAGCDHWRSANALIGECAKSQMVPGQDRALALGMRSMTAPLAAGHVMTQRADHCANFADSFPWGTLPLPYLKRVGANTHG